MDLLNTKINIPVGILVCDSDNLKSINDSLGHISGDKLLKSTANILQSVFNDEHVVSRTGGDEFIIIVKDKTFSQVDELYKNLQTAIKQHNQNNIDMPIDISIGLAYSENSIHTMESTFNIADNNMYIEKRRKKQK